MASDERVLTKEQIVEVVYLEDIEGYLARKTKEGDDFPSLSIEDVTEGFVTLKEAKKRLTIAHLQYVRRLLKRGALEGIKVKVSSGTRWLVTIESVEGYSLRQRTKSSLRNYTLRLDPKDLEAIENFLTKSGVPYELVIQYDSKRKPLTKEEDLLARVIDSIS